MPATYDIKLKMKDDERKRFGLYLQERIQLSRNGMRGLLSKLKELNKFYEGRLPEKDFPWPDCSNICVPLIQWIVDTWSANINEVILGVHPMTLVKPTEPADRERAGVLENLLEYVQTKMMKLAEVMDSVFLYGIKNGTAITKLPWREEYRTVKDEYVVSDPMTGQAMMDEMGQPQTEIKATQEVKYRGPKPELVTLENFVIYPLTSRTIEEATIVGDRFRLTKDKLKRRIKEGYYEEKWATPLLEKPDNELSTGQDLEDEEILDYLGIERLDHDEYWFWEVITGYDVDDDGLLEDCVFTVEAETGTIVRAVEYPYWHGKRYEIGFVPFIRPGWFLGRGMMEILENVQREINAIHNQRSDATTLALCNAFKRQRGSNVKPDAVKLSPGAVIDVDSMEELEQLVITPLVPGLDIEQIDRDYGERSSGVNDLSLGKETEGSQKTLGEIKIAANAGGVRFGDVIRRLQYSMTELAEQTIGLIYQFMTDEEIARITGQLTNPVKTTNNPETGMEEPLLSRTDLKKQWDFIPHGNTGTANREQQRQEAVFLTQILTQSPLVAQSPIRMHRVYADLLAAFDRDDVEAYIGSDEDAQMLEQQLAQASQNMAAEQSMAQQQEQTSKGEEMGMRREDMQMKRDQGMLQMQQSAEENEANRQNQLAIAKTRGAASKSKGKKK